MTESPALLLERPSDDVLARRLKRIVAPDGQLMLLQREPKGSGTFPKEVVRCRLGDGKERAFFCKYAAPSADAHGHRRGVAYEADVYRKVLAQAQLPTPRFVGAYTDAGRDEHWLILEFLEGGERLKRCRCEMATAARWLGSFHRAHEHPRHRDGLAFLIVYDEEYYLGWARRTAEYSVHLQGSVPWLAPLCERFTEVIRLLLAGPETVIHGEYTVKNVMVRGHEVYPTDWESAALAVGEIDLMCLVDAWPEEIVAECVRAYAEERWGNRVPSGYEERLDAAELYLHFRWLGDNPDGMVKKTWRFERLEYLAHRLGVLP